MRNQVLLSQHELLRACHSPEDTALAQARKVVAEMEKACPHVNQHLIFRVRRSECSECWADLKAALE